MSLEDVIISSVALTAAVIIFGMILIFIGAVLMFPVYVLFVEVQSEQFWLAMVAFITLILLIK